METIVGRARELAEVDRMLDGVRDGRGRLLLVSGPAGIGKTCLATAAVTAAGQVGMPVAQGRAVDDPGAPVLWPWSRALRGWAGMDRLPAADEDEPGAAARFRLFTAIADQLITRAKSKGLLVVLEDMHWADRTSVLLLRHLAAEVAGERLGILVTYRDTARHGPLLDTVSDLIRGDHAQLLELTGLTADALAGWLPQLGGSADPELAAALHRRTGGNPLLVRLVAQDLALRGPPVDPSALDRLLSERPQLRRLVSARLAGLSRDVREVLDAAGVLGEQVVPDLVAAVLDRPRPQVDQLLGHALTAEVLRNTGPAGGVRFEHALVRDAVYAELAPARRAELHRRSALALASRDPELAGTIAAHWQRADGAQSASQCQVWAERADEQARRALAWEDAARYAELALSSARRANAPRAEEARLLIRLGEARFLAHAVSASVKACAEAADHAEAAGRPDLAAQAGLVIHGVGDPRVYRAIAGICDRALTALPADAHALRSRLHAQLAVGVAESQGGLQAAELAAGALREAERSGDPAAILEAIAARHLAISVPHQVAERLELGRRAVELGAASRRPIAALWGHLWRLDAALQLGNLEAAEHELAEIDRIARQRRSALAAWHQHRFRTALTALTGDFDAARAANTAARQLAQRCGDISMTGLSSAFQLQLAILRGDPAELDPQFQKIVQQAPPIPLVKISHPLLHAIQGHLDQAREEFEEFRHLPATFPVGVRWLGTMVQIATAAELLDDCEVAAQIYPLLAPIAHYYAGDGSGAVFNHGALARLAGEMALTAGHADDAVTHLRQAIAMNARIGARPFTALSRLGLARALSANPPSGARPADPAQLAEAAQLAARAAGEFRRLDMPGPLASAAHLAEHITAARRSRSPLSPRETEVADLAAHGLSNRQIATRLVLSERTVETHISSILSKLAVRSRTDIATWVLRQHAEPEH